MAEIAPRTREDLRRLALVMGVVAVDAYMHWAVLRRLSEVRRQGELPKGLRQLQVPFDELASLAETTVTARRQRVDSRPWVQLKNAAQKRLQRLGLTGVALQAIFNGSAGQEVVQTVVESRVEVG